MSNINEGKMSRVFSCCFHLLSCIIELCACLLCSEVEKALEPRHRIQERPLPPTPGRPNTSPTPPHHDAATSRPPPPLPGGQGSQPPRLNDKPKPRPSKGISPPTAQSTSRTHQSSAPPRPHSPPPELPPSARRSTRPPPPVKQKTMSPPPQPPVKVDRKNSFPLTSQTLPAKRLEEKSTHSSQVRSEETVRPPPVRSNKPLLPSKPMLPPNKPQVTRQQRVATTVGPKPPVNKKKNWKLKGCSNKYDVEELCLDIASQVKNIESVCGGDVGREPLSDMLISLFEMSEVYLSSATEMADSISSGMGLRRCCTVLREKLAILEDLAQVLVGVSSPNVIQVKKLDSCLNVLTSKCEEIRMYIVDD